MHDRLITLFGGVASLVIIIALLLPPDPTGLANISRPTTTDRGIHGLKGLKTWLDDNHIPNISLRRRYTSLPIDTRLAESGNLVIISLPQTTEPSRTELEALRDWIVQGNFALLLGAVNDRPEWSLAGTGDTGSVTEALGIEFTAPSRERTEGESDGSPDSRREPLSINIHEASSLLLGEDRQAMELEPVFAHPLLEGVQTVATFRSLLYDEPQTTVTGAHANRQLLALLRRDDPPGVGLWEFRAGSGGGWISSHPDLFGNVTLGQADNARLLASLLAAALDGNGHVIFDDMHFGISDLYDPDNFFRDPRLHNTLLFLGLFWLLYLLGYSNRLAPPAKQPYRPRASDFVEAMAGFFARRLHTAATGRGILEHFSSEVRDHFRVRDPQIPLWELLRSRAMVPRDDLRDLEQLAQTIGNNRKVNLIRLTRTIDRIKRTLQ